LLVLAAPAVAQPQSLGIFGMWGAFRGDDRCYAIAEPFQAPRPEGWRPFVSVGHWPGRRISGQLHVRLSREKRPGSAVLLRMTAAAFSCAVAAATPGRLTRADDEIMAAMRTGIA
jgi:hypothetical protein